MLPSPLKDVLDRCAEGEIAMAVLLSLGSSLRKVAQNFFFVCDTFTRMNSSPSSRPSGSPDDEEYSAGGLPAEGEFLAEGGPGDLVASALWVFDICASKRQDLQVIWEWGAGSEIVASGYNTARGPPVP
jgi:hypothetical protein